MQNKLIDILANPAQYKHYVESNNKIIDVVIAFSDIQEVELDQNNHCLDGASIKIYQEHSSPKSKKIYINKLTKTIDEAKKIIKNNILDELESSLYHAYNEALQIAIKNKITLGNDINNIFHKFIKAGDQDE